jgi:hypothetical protein
VIPENHETHDVQGNMEGTFSLALERNVLLILVKKKEENAGPSGRAV